MKTFERGEDPDTSIFDIFNSRGAFIGRKDMHILTLGDAYVCGRSRGEYLYCFEEKPDGIREFVAYRMTWE